MGQGVGAREVLLRGLSPLVTRSLRYVAFDQLHRDYGVLADARPAEDVIVMVESGGSGGGTCAPVARQVYQFLHDRELGLSKGLASK
jgi:hypothetical protein